MINLEAHPDGVILPVQAQSRARKNGLTGTHDGALKVSVTQAPEKGKANEAIIKVLADELDLKKSQLELLTGETSTKKRFLVRNITLEELAERLNRREKLEQKVAKDAMKVETNS